MSGHDDILVAYIAGEVDGDQERVLESRLFEGQFDQRDAEWLAAATLAMRRAIVRGTFEGLLKEGDLAGLRARGLRILEVTYRPGEIAEVDMSLPFDLLVAEWNIDFGDARRIDGELLRPDGHLLKRFEAIVPADRHGERFYGCCERDLAVASANLVPEMRIRLVRVEDDGSEREIARVGMNCRNVPPA